ncbi:MULTISPECIES: DUF350 domain-containing protein [Methylobacterium]|uniref:DUF350 domain-containing protein n=2 Tax=Pseudomonadota TaxID=1224 RepID=A0ABQ4SUP1_9HYPH|nr:MULTISPECIES: DUF350 domain-containing protein [Methylobacterium]PIU08598.1 MAG: hypothetical protein COT56_00755 [Methylobacterium sp. CG09_land_8_20_14_0_10_71_15]PIU14612.1 MAG: hypothetical protein COT28_06950 [Methylobacterium sp. CG08_land_8_20_14_0_20_71_15]GBU18855.1 DUF350 domain-containing protein [Methylobacterium sp.]GJE06930.1 hypothetical protein AOPFMNJM_2253 [Methylobacterium jeotgali]
MVSISGLPAFLAYYATALGLVGLFLAVYLTATPHREIALIRAGNVAAAIALGASLIGYALPLAVSIYNAQSILDCIVWGLVALVVQVLIYWLVRLLLPDLSRRIAEGEVAAAVLLASASLAGGVINAASMTY